MSYAFSLKPHDGTTKFFKCAEFQTPGVQSLKKFLGQNASYQHGGDGGRVVPTYCLAPCCTAAPVLVTLPLQCILLVCHAAK